MATNAEKRLLRSPDDRMLAGVCAGIADFFGLEGADLNARSDSFRRNLDLGLRPALDHRSQSPETIKSLKTMAEDNIKAQMRKGILEYCILAILSREDSYAPKIIAELKEAEMIVVEGTLYPILTRQKNAGLLTYRWEESPQGPPRKYYMLTEKGREYLRSLDEAWDELVGQIRIIRHGNTQTS